MKGIDILAAGCFDVTSAGGWHAVADSVADCYGVEIGLRLAKVEVEQDRVSLGGADALGADLGAGVLVGGDGAEGFILRDDGDIEIAAGVAGPRKGSQGARAGRRENLDDEAGRFILAPTCI